MGFWPYLRQANSSGGISAFFELTAGTRTVFFTLDFLLHYTTKRKNHKKIFTSAFAFSNKIINLFFFTFSWCSGIDQHSPSMHFPSAHAHGTKAFSSRLISVPVKRLVLEVVRSVPLLDHLSSHSTRFHLQWLTTDQTKRNCCCCYYLKRCLNLGLRIGFLAWLGFVRSGHGEIGRARYGSKPKSGAWIWWW